MNSLYAFLHPVEEQQEKDVYISDRFRDENGNVQPFRIRALSQEDNERINRMCTTEKTVRGNRIEKHDSAAYTNRLVLEGTVFPNFAAKELCDHYKVMDPAEVPKKMLYAGEFAALMKAIMELSGFNRDLSDIEDAAKN